VQFAENVLEVMFLLVNGDRLRLNALGRFIADG
jgi:hypothetical protein